MKSLKVDKFSNIRKSKAYSSTLKQMREDYIDSYSLVALSEEDIRLISIYAEDSTPFNSTYGNSEAIELNQTLAKMADYPKISYKGGLLPTAIETKINLSMEFEPRLNFNSTTPSGEIAKHYAERLVIPEGKIKYMLSIDGQTGKNIGGMTMPMEPNAVMTEAGWAYSYSKIICHIPCARRTVHQQYNDVVF